MSHYFLKTDNGQHSAESWAMRVATIIFDIDSQTQAERLLHATRVQLGIAYLLAPLFKEVQEAERKGLAENENHSDTDHAPRGEAIKAIVDQIEKLGTQSPWADLLKTPAWQMTAYYMITQCVHTAQKEERYWHADTTNNESAKRYKAQRI